VKKSGVYSVRVADSLGCSRDISFAVTVIPIPSADAGTDVSICQGESRQLTATGGDSYVWTPTEGLSCAGCSDPVASPRATTTYHVRVSNASGCSAVDSVTVYVAQAAISVGSDGATQSTLTVEDAGIDVENCKEVLLYNSDTVPRTVDNGALLHNTAFSCPPGQFPLTLPPRGSAPLTICFATSVPGSFDDTLILNICPSIRVFLSSRVDLGELSGQVCQTYIRARIENHPTDVLKIGSPYPNPSRTVVTVPVIWQRLSSGDAGIERGSLYDAFGVEVKQGVYRNRESSSTSEYEQGEIKIDVRNVSPGTYFVRLVTSRGLFVVPVVVLH
jgi:hypothetical protein